MARRSIDAYREMLDLAANVGASILGCHGRVGRVCALTMRVEEVALLTDSGRRVAEHAATLGIRVAFEVLNRYETHLVCHVEAALGLVLDTYQMNIEEEDPIKSVEAASDGMILLHVADSNCRAPGRGHVPFPRLLGAVRRLGYRRPWIVECTPPAANPFAVNSKSFDRTLEEVASSISYLRAVEEGAPGSFANDCTTSNRSYNGDHHQRMLL